MSKKDIKELVRESYGAIAKQGSSCCESSCCCGSAVSARDQSRKIGYGDQELDSVPEGANLGLGCGNPVAFASLAEGETVLDLGSGAGIDCFLAAERVGPSGKVIGVDMTPEMVERATANAASSGYSNIEFRLGEIESLPVEDNSVDVVISNCVVNLSPDKEQAFREAFRVLRPGARLMVSDIVLLGELPERLRESEEAYVACVAGAVMREDYLRVIEAAGFVDVTVQGESPFVENLVVSAKVSARKPLVTA
jgi:arsenite methyltransferase